MSEIQALFAHIATETGNPLPICYPYLQVILLNEDVNLLIEDLQEIILLETN